MHLGKTAQTTMIIVFIMALAAVILHFMGRIPWCSCGIGFGTTSAWSSETSQHLIDPYTGSHILHGLVFFLVLYWINKKYPLSIQMRLILAELIEVGWEILENSPLIINRYRSATAALDYTGDSILNSMGDIVAALCGFWIAWKLPWRWSIAFFIAMELIMLYWIRDNLTLNVVMLLFPIKAIKEWQIQ